MTHAHHVSSEVQDLITVASRVKIDATLLDKINFPNVDAYNIPWQKAWDELVTKAIDEAEPYWKLEDIQGAPKRWPYRHKALELRSGGLWGSTIHRSLVIPLMMTNQADIIAFSEKQDGEDADAGTFNNIQFEDWRIAFYVFEGNQLIATRYSPIRFIWVQFTKPEVKERTEPDTRMAIQRLLD
ncbi:hypothetical protein NPX13_g4452 [Xylaria arbuscula]|uniref:Uncharacterized protein n=1 Tax=Xylaria arbuscula TaxID=114810 RepID=A0A9W8NG19_9PEZI|nr:hypothetical protein NPX13_g4452 [Xylaria arbuscula]